MRATDGSSPWVDPFVSTGFDFVPCVDKDTGEPRIPTAADVGWLMKHIARWPYFPADVVADANTDPQAKAALGGLYEVYLTLAAEYGDGPDFPDYIPTRTWWRLWEEPTMKEGIGGTQELPLQWCEPPNEKEREFVELCCHVISGLIFGTLIRQIQKLDGYAPDLRPSSGSDPAYWRPTHERLFDRLHLNFVPLAYTDSGGREASILVPLESWRDGDGNSQAWQTTLLGMRHESNAWYRFRMAMATNDFGHPLGAVVGLPAAPDSFALPIEWHEARYSGVSRTVSLSVPEDVGLAVKQMALLPETAMTEDTPLATAVWLGGLLVGDTLGLLEVFTGDDVWSFWPKASLLDAGDRDWLHQMSWKMFEACRQFNIKVPGYGNLLPVGALLGLNEYSIFALERAFSTTAELRNPWYREQYDVGDYTYGVSYSTDLYFPEFYEPPTPCIVLGDRIRAYADCFGGFEETTRVGSQLYVGGDVPEASDVDPSEQAALNAYMEVLKRFWPIHDAAMLFDGASIILEQLVLLDDGILSLSDLAVSEGMVGNAVRRMAKEKGILLLVDVLGGASPSSIIRFLVRQLLTDIFVGSLVADGYSASCLWGAFCWTEKAKTRDRIDRVFGEPALIDSVEAVAAYLKDMGYDSTLAPGIWQGLDAAMIKPYLRKFKAGAMYRVIDAITQAGTSDLAVVEEVVDVCDLALIRSWLESARVECVTCELNSYFKTSHDWKPSIDVFVPDDGEDYPGPGEVEPPGVVEILPGVWKFPINNADPSEPTPT